MLSFPWPQREALVKAFVVWALFAAGGWVSIPKEWLPLYSHCVGFGFFSVIITKQTRWLLPLLFGGFAFLLITRFAVPADWYALTTHITGYGALLIILSLFITVRCIYSYRGIHVPDLPNFSSLPTIPSKDQLVSILFEAYDAIPTRETVRVEAGKMLETAKLVLHEHMAGFEGPFPFPMMNIQMPDLKLSSLLSIAKEGGAAAGAAASMPGGEEEEEEEEEEDEAAAAKRGRYQTQPDRNDGMRSGASQPTSQRGSYAEDPFSQSTAVYILVRAFALYPRGTLQFWLRIISAALANQEMHGQHKAGPLGGGGNDASAAAAARSQAQASISPEDNKRSGACQRPEAAAEAAMVLDPETPQEYSASRFSSPPIKVHPKHSPSNGEVPSPAKPEARHPKGRPAVKPSKRSKAHPPPSMSLQAQAAQLLKEIEELEVQVACVCSLAAADALMLPCGHFLCCNCAQSSMRKKECLSCGKLVETWQMLRDERG